MTDNPKPKTKTYIQAVCARCGKKYYKSETNHRQIYCSNRCNQMVQNARRYGCRVHAKTCAVCGKPFETVRSLQKYCSAECAHSAHLKHMRTWYAKKSRESAQPVQPRTLMQRIMAFFRRSK